MRQRHSFGSRRQASARRAVCRRRSPPQGSDLEKPRRGRNLRRPERRRLLDLPKGISVVDGRAREDSRCACVSASELGRGRGRPACRRRALEDARDIAHRSHDTTPRHDTSVVAKALWSAFVDLADGDGDRAFIGGGAGGECVPGVEPQRECVFGLGGADPADEPGPVELIPGRERVQGRGAGGAFGDEGRGRWWPVAVWSEGSS